MPLHDWSRVPPGIVHDFHLSWAVHLSRALNGGILPATYFSLVESRDDPYDMRVRGVPAGMSEALVYAARRRTVVVRQAVDDRISAFVQTVPPGVKEDDSTLEAFADAAVQALGEGRHLLMLDLFPPARLDPEGMHGALWRRIEGSGYEVPPDRPLTLAAYASGSVITAYVEPVAVGSELPDMPLFLDPEHYVNVPLESMYRAAWEGMPERWRKVIKGRN